MRDIPLGEVELTRLPTAPDGFEPRLCRRRGASAAEAALSLGYRLAVYIGSSRLLRTGDGLSTGDLGEDIARADEAAQEAGEHLAGGRGMDLDRRCRMACQGIDDPARRAPSATSSPGATSNSTSPLAGAPAPWPCRRAASRRSARRQ
ncbi:MAG: hypothetical protein U1E17_09255 [Geminicoccaceae bacterium]